MDALKALFSSRAGVVSEIIEKSADLDMKYLNSGSVEFPSYESGVDKDTLPFGSMLAAVVPSRGCCQGSLTSWRVKDF